MRHTFAALRPPSRSARHLLIAVGAAALLAPGASAVAASAPKAHHIHRIGGKVKKAWPAVGGRPTNRLDRWLARQVGAKPVRVCATLPRRQRRACRVAAHPPAGRRMLTSLPVGEGTLGRVIAPSTSVSLAPVVSGPLSLLRSFDIPQDDPSYDRLLNWSWTYDSAVAAAAFSAHGQERQAQRLLDQLSALQGRDGSINFAFNVATGEGETYISSGTVAWVGLAATTYDQAFGSNRYADTATRAARYLQSLSRPDGLIRGGPTVQWASTLHNMVAYLVFQGVGWNDQANQVGNAIDSELLVQDENGSHFREGAGDDTQALDTQAIGSYYLASRGRSDIGRQVLDGAEQAYALSDRSIDRSGDTSTFNQTYQAAGPFSGYRPYLGASAPDVIWFEGTAEMRMAMTMYGESTGTLDDSMSRWLRVTGTGKAAPLGSDRTGNSRAYGEYHVWPTGAAAAWTILSGAAPAFFLSSLPIDVSLVSDWTIVRGAGKVTTSPSGSVTMLADNGGERRVLAGASTASDYTATADAELRYGSGYAVLVRAHDGDAGLSGYEVQLDRAAGNIAVRQWSDDRELSVPLAMMVPGSDFDWNARHTLAVTVSGNTMNVSVDGGQVLAVDDLASASANAAAASGIGGVTAPGSGQYGLRGWSASQVLFRQFTVGGIVHLAGTPAIAHGVTYDDFENLDGSQSLYTTPRGTLPTATSILYGPFQGPTNRGDNLGTRLRAILTVPTTGDYTFAIASDDNGALFLSPSTDPTLETKIAYVANWTAPLTYTWEGNQTSAPISLTAGQQVFIEAWAKEGGGGDNLDVAWTGPGIAQQLIAQQYLTPTTLGCSGWCPGP